MNEFQKRVKKIAASEFPVQTVCKRDGTVETKKGYYFPHNYTAKRWGEDIKEALEAAGLKVVVDTWYVLAPFPKMSCLVASVRETCD